MRVQVARSDRGPAAIDNHHLAVDIHIAALPPVIQTGKTSQRELRVPAQRLQVFDRSSRLIAARLHRDSRDDHHHLDPAFQGRFESRGDEWSGDRLVFDIDRGARGVDLAQVLLGNRVLALGYRNRFTTGGWGGIPVSSPMDIALDLYPARATRGRNRGWKR